MSGPGSRYKFQTPLEKIERLDIWALVFNADLFEKTGKRVVILACGHKAFTRNINRAHCPRCQRMFDTGFDWDGFRNLRTVSDILVWPDDPCRRFNEPHDLAGNPVEPFERSH